MLLKRMFGCRLVLMAVCAGNQLKLRVCDKILIGIAQPSMNPGMLCVYLLPVLRA